MLQYGWTLTDETLHAFWGDENVYVVYVDCVDYVTVVS